jgi:hypothetical protein
MTERHNKTPTVQWNLGNEHKKNFIKIAFMIIWEWTENMDFFQTNYKDLTASQKKPFGFNVDYLFS